MLAFTLRRVLVALAVAFTVSVASFLLLHLSGDLATAIAGPEATGPQIAQIRQDYGLDQPLLTQFLTWGWRALHLDFGNSFYFRERVIDLRPPACRSPSISASSRWPSRCSWRSPSA